MMKIIHTMFFTISFILVFLSINVYSNCKNTDVKKVLEIYKSKGSKEALQNIPWTFTVTLWDKKIDYKVIAFHRTYESIIKTIIKNGFEIVDYKDCRPLKKAKKIFPDHYKINEAMPYFSVWKVRKK